MGSIDLDCSIDLVTLLGQIELDSNHRSEICLPSPTDFVFSPTMTSSSSFVTASLNDGGALPPPVGSRRRPQLSCAISLPESSSTGGSAFNNATTTAADFRHQLLSPVEPRFNSTPARLEDVFAAVPSQFHHPLYQQQQALCGGFHSELGARTPSVHAAGDLSRSRAFSVEDAQSFADTLRRSSAAMTSAVLQQQLLQQQGTVTQNAAAAGLVNRKLSSSSFDVETESSICQQQQQQQGSVRYKTELCRPFEEHGTCRYGSKCQFAHGRDELRTVNRHPKYKTEMCRTFHTSGYCPYGTRCHFVHETCGATDQQQTAGDPIENGLRHQLNSDEHETVQLTAARKKDVERRRSSLMQSHLQQMKQQPILDDSASYVEQDRRVSVSCLGYNQISSAAAALPMARATSVDIAASIDMSCSSFYEKLAPPPGLSLPVDIAVNPAVASQRSNGSSPTSDFTSGFSSGVSNGDANSGPGSPTNVPNLQLFQLPAVSTSGYRARHAHLPLTASSSLPLTFNESLESPEVSAMLAAIFAERNGSSGLQQPSVMPCRRLSAVEQSASAIMSGSVDAASAAWLPDEVSSFQQDNLNSLQMMASLKPDELAKLIQLVKFCNSQSDSSISGSGDSLAADAASASGIFPSRQSSINGHHHQSLQGRGSFGLTLGNDRAGNTWSQGVSCASPSTVCSW